MNTIALASWAGAFALVGCGGRTSLTDGLDASHTMSSNAVSGRSSGSASGSSTSGSASGSSGGAGSSCDEGLNASQTPPVGCTSEGTIWLATPYSPAADILVDQVQVFASSMQLAVLTSVGSAPGSVVFTTSFDNSGGPAWESASVSPPALLHGGQPYFIAFLDVGGFWSCAEDGPEEVEFAAPALTGPWAVDGSDAYVVRVLGTCP